MDLAGCKKNENETKQSEIELKQLQTILLGKKGHLVYALPLLRKVLLWLASFFLEVLMKYVCFHKVSHSFHFRLLKGKLEVANSVEVCNRNSVNEP